MSKKAAEINLTMDERKELESWLRKGTVEQRLVQRARIVLDSATGKTTSEIATRLKLRPATVSKWRTRFYRDRMVGLLDAPRPGKTATYDSATEKRILTHLDNAPPAGYATWTGRLLAKALGDVSPHHIWRVLRRHGIHFAEAS